MQGKFCHITPVLHQLHWLPVSFRINFTILPLTFKAIHELAPSYINELVKIKPLHLRYGLRSNDRMLLSHLNFKMLTTLGDRAFVASAPNLWNNLPLEIRCFLLIGIIDLDWQRIRHMAKWICIFCFEMNGSTVFVWTVLWCDHLEEHRLSEDHAHLPVHSNVSRKRLQLYIVPYTFSLIVLNWPNS